MHWSTHRNVQSSGQSLCMDHRYVPLEGKGSRSPYPRGTARHHGGPALEEAHLRNSGAKKKIFLFFGANYWRRIETRQCTGLLQRELRDGDRSQLPLHGGQSPKATTGINVGCICTAHCAVTIPDGQ